MTGFYALAQKDAMVLGGHAIDLARISQPLYVLGSEEDHITSWRGTFKTTALCGGPARDVLCASAHILGIINPPVPSAKHGFTVGNCHGEGGDWLAKHRQVPGGWWPDWAHWLARNCGPLQAQPPTHTQKYPAICPTPGTYVLER